MKDLKMHSNKKIKKKKWKAVITPDQTPACRSATQKAVPCYNKFLQSFALMENLKMFSRSNLSYRAKREEARWASSTCLSLKKVQTDWL